MVKETEESPGVLSSMRKNVKRAVVAGMFMIISGIALTTYCVITKTPPDYITVLTILVTTGPAMITFSLGAKAYQSKFEQPTISEK